MNGSFGSYLRRFAYAIDVVDDATLKRVGELIKQYVAKELQVQFFEVMQESVVGGREGLRTLWSSEPGREVSDPIAAASGEFTNQVTFSFAGNHPLWVVADGKGELQDAPSHLDLWTGASGFPCTRRTARIAPTTSIVVPLARGNRRLGAMCLDSESYLEITELAKTELLVLAEAIAILYYDYEASRHQRESTEQALGELNKILNSTAFPQLTKPQIFFASSAKADPAVVGLIRDVLDEYADHARPIFWDDIRQSGPIDRQVADEILKCKLAICYLSEPDGNGDGCAYVDNRNVLFEAGMLQGLVERDEAAGWIPVREQASPDPPFDFASHRIEVVPRGRDGSLNREGFQERLRSRISALIGA